MPHLPRLSLLSLLSLFPLSFGARQEIFAFYVIENNEIWRHFDWNVTTTVAVFGAGQTPPELVSLAHSHGAKVVRGVDFDKTQLTNITARGEFVEKTVNKVWNPLPLAAEK